MRILLPALFAAFVLAAPAFAAEPGTPFRTTAAKSAVPVQPRLGTFAPRKGAKADKPQSQKLHRLPSGQTVKQATKK